MQEQGPFKSLGKVYKLPLLDTNETQLSFGKQGGRFYGKVTILAQRQAKQHMMVKCVLVHW